jgi:hypothetical protein
VRRDPKSQMQRTDPSLHPADSVDLPCKSLYPKIQTLRLDALTNVAS